MSHAEFTLTHLLLNAVERDPQHLAIVDGGQAYTYAELWHRVSCLAEALKEEGLRSGDRVGVYLDKSWDAVVTILSVACAGGIFVNINPLLKEAQVRHIVSDCGVRMMVAESRKLGALALPPLNTVFYRGEVAQTVPFAARMVALSTADQAAPRPSPRMESNERDMATIIYTSGSTGRPKGIVLTHHNLVAGAQIVSTYLENTRDDRVLSVLPFSFDYGLSQLTTMVMVGGTLVLQRSLLPGDLLQSLRREGITGLAGVPSFWNLLLQNRRGLEQQPLGHLRYVTNSGGMVPAGHLELLRKFLPATKIYLMYGLTEAFRSTYLPPEHVDRGPACIGRAIPNTDIWVVNERGEQCQPDEVGELVHRGPTVALGYWGDAERTRAMFRPNPFAPPEIRDSEMVVYSGDLVKRDAAGFLYFIGRRDELIKTEGYRVSPQEVEELLHGVPGVAEAAAFGEPDRLAGQRIVAVVSPADGAQLTEGMVRDLCSRTAPPYLVPRTVHVLKELPKTPTGKIDRGALKHEYAGDKDRTAAEAAG